MTEYLLAYTDDVQPEAREAFGDAVEAYIDDCLYAIRTIEHPTAEESPITRWLPPVFADRYDDMFARRWTTTVVCLSWRLAQCERATLLCVAEELALNALVEEAETELELAGHTLDAPYSLLEGQLQADMDWKYLFLPAFDGIDTSTLGADMGMGDLGLDHWFEPFYDGARGLPHPYCRSR